MTEFNRPYDLLAKQSKFSGREVGITHPELFSFIKLADNGDIQIMAQDGLGIIISSTQHCIFLVADNIKFLTKEDEGLKWNRLAFNPKATKYSEPAFIYPKKQTSGLYDGISDFV
jgi:hypothetical protein